MATWTVCDFGDCQESAVLRVEMTEGEFQGVEFDACSFPHAEAYFDSLYTLPLEEEGAEA